MATALRRRMVRGPRYPDREPLTRRVEYSTPRTGFPATGPAMPASTRNYADTFR